MLELISLSGYLTFKMIAFSFSHSSANRAGDDERRWARFISPLEEVNMAQDSNAMMCAGTSEYLPCISFRKSAWTGLVPIRHLLLFHEI